MEIEARKLKSLLALAKRAADGKSYMPALRCVRLAVVAGLLRLDATDRKSWLTLTAPAEGDLPPVAVDLGKVALVLGAKAKRSSTEIANLTVGWKPGPAPSSCKTPHPEKPGLLCDERPGHSKKHSAYEIGVGRVEWECAAIELPAVPDEPVLHVEVGARTFTIPATRTEGFPKRPEVGAARQVVSYDSERLAEALAYVLPAAGADETRRHLCGLWLRGRDVFALDGHRLHVAGGFPAIKKSPAFLSTSAATALRAVLAAAAGPAELHVHEATSKAARSGATWWRVPLAGGAHAELHSAWSDIGPPPVEQIVPEPKNATVRVEVERTALAEAFALAGKVSTRGTARVSVNGAFKVTTESAEGGEVVEELPAKITGELEAGVNAGYMVEALAALPARVVLASEGDPLAPLRLDGVRGERRFAVVMPVRL